jgi:glucosyl-3-phosphoglycerate phosphatase
VIPVVDDAPDVRRLVLWRHGRTEWNDVGRAQGHADVPLDRVGYAQARRAATLLASYEPVFVWSSDLVRARQTADELIALTGHQLVLDKRLREYDVGARQGMTRAEFRAAFPELYTHSIAGDDIVRVPGAEVTEDVRTRMLAVIEDATAALDVGDTGVLVGHGASLRTGLLAFFGIAVGGQDATPAGRRREMLAGMANCAWSVVEQHPSYGWQIVDYNAHNLPERVSLDDSPLTR